MQAVSATGVPATYKLYFAVPSSWSDCTRVIIYAVATNDTTKDPYTLEMQEDGKTGDGRKIYSADLNKDKHYPYGGLNGLEFHGYKGDTLEDSVVIADVNTRTWWRTFDPTRDDYIGGNYYDAEGAEGEKWSTYTVTVRHNQFAGKEMSFENKTGEKLTNVQAWFYEPNDKGELIQVGGPIPLNSAESDSGIAPNSTATFTIPNELCSMLSLHGVRIIPNNPAKSITSMVKMLVVLVVMIKNPLHTTVIQGTALSILAKTTKDGV